MKGKKGRKSNTNRCIDIMLRWNDNKIVIENSHTQVEELGFKH